MKTDRWIIATLFFSIFLYAEQIKEKKPFDTLPIKTEIKKDKLTDIKKEDNKTSICSKLQANLEIEFKKRKSLRKDITHKRFLKRFYRQNSYVPLWFDANGVSKKSLSLFKEIEDDITLNRDSKIYKRYQYVKSYLKSKERNNIHIELYLTALYIDFLNHAIYGSIKWKSFALKLKSLRKRGIPANWVEYKPKFSMSELLLEPNIKDTIDEVTPQRFGYVQLIKALKKLLELKKKGGWEQLPHIKKLEFGDTGLIVLKLRERLVLSGDLTSCESSTVNLFETEEKGQSSADIKIQPDATFDKCLEDGVKRFQRRHGLEADGIVGSGTQKVLNTTVEDKIKKVLLNIDRVKRLPRSEDDRYLVVNIPEFMLHYIDDDIEKETIPVIVGKQRHNTPIFKGDISYIVLNPYWKVPEGIVRKEIIPHMIRNPRYLRKEGLEIHKTWYEKSARINPYNIYWEDYYNGYMKFPYRIMQPPGPKNALGKIKFKFPNRFNVYLHDTPTKRLFQKTKRAFSHGCIRVSKPVELFETIASFNNIDLNKSKKILKGKNKVQINLKNKVPVYIIYLTAGYSEKNREVEFRNDIYGYDKIQRRGN